MHDFGTVIYLDVPKTGSVFISRMLERHVRAASVRARKHTPVMARVPDVFYFISARRPLDQYVSLFRYGLARAGSLRQAMIAAGAGTLYDIGNGPRIPAFERWLDWVLTPANAAALGEGYDPGVASLMGFQSYRFLRMAMPRQEKSWTRAPDAVALMADYARHSLFDDAVVRTESLREDLIRLIDGPLAPHLRSPAEARAFVAAAEAVNVSRAAPKLASARFSGELAGRVRACEWFLDARYAEWDRAAAAD